MPASSRSIPQAGILWRDLYPNNFVDLDPGPGVRDYACGTQTYDGHTGTDSDIRSFREMDIGVPVFAALDGRVISVQDGEFDRNHGPTVSRVRQPRRPRARNGPLHDLRPSAQGDRARSGTTGSSRGSRSAGRRRAGTRAGRTSTSPRRSAGEVDEPFAGPCNEGPSGYSEQVPIPTEPYLRDLALSTKPMTGKRDLPYDRAVRTGTLVRGTQVVLRPRRARGASDPGEGLLRMRCHPAERLGDAGDRDRRFEPLMDVATGAFPRPGAVRPKSGGGGSSSTSTGSRWPTPFDVVATKTRGAATGRQSAITAELVPAKPTAEGRRAVPGPDVARHRGSRLDIVRYRYRWTVGGKLVRAVQSAALSDVLRKGAAPARASRFAARSRRARRRSGRSGRLPDGGHCDGR